ncbi:MAG: 3-hydroxyacyl-CoA dehydrogenase NAD-binding domain-containing protein [Chitinophagales bacterium]|nr:3-hydroxyacyl-CoA dehydrogenase NAD-binding domain-containing protein [Chitinophagales bacterium]MDW8393848.1 3-hydroxyacyl-CoA dehydrogenase NAD-binding domain-containing protein [Chitinophagales bacterium]
MKRIIQRVAVLGAGVMGSRIACHFANIGVPVLLLDRPADAVPEMPDPAEQRNRLVNESLQAALRSKPSPLFTAKRSRFITTGNFSDDLPRIAECDWVIEAVVERAEVKSALYEQVERFRKPGTLISSNTSSIPIHLLAQGRSDDFQQHFCGTHFFNPPRYLRLLEIIPTPQTRADVVDFLMHYGDVFLGKETVRCKDTPAFIANRIGVYSVMHIFHLTEELGLTIDEVDFLTGPLIGRPKSATYRTADVIGLDTLANVARFVYASCPNDEARQRFVVPAWLDQLIGNQWLGDKSGQGFYRKEKQNGKTVYPSLDLPALQYSLKAKPAFATADAIRRAGNPGEALQCAVSGTDKAGEFYRRFFYGLFSYVSHRIPEISDELFWVDAAMNAGFGWQQGPFAAWDAIGLRRAVEGMQQEQYAPAPWVEDLLRQGHDSFYRWGNNAKQYYDVSVRSYRPVPGSESFLLLEDRSGHVVWRNSGCRLIDLGDGVVNLEWQTKMNTIGGEVLEGVNQAIALAERDFAGLVISNQGENFSAGANLALILMLAAEQDFDELERACRMFQQTSLRIRYSAVPVVIAPHQLTLGGGCEFTLHADAVVAAAETYMGLVEVGVGIIPAGGGTKELAVRAADAVEVGLPELPVLQRFFTLAAMGKVSTSALEAMEMGLLRQGVDRYCLNAKRLLAEAKHQVLELVRRGYTKPRPREDIRVPGRSVLAALFAGIEAMVFGRYASEHDRLIARKLAYVMCGGDLSVATPVSEQYLLDLEREAFLSLVTTRKSMERMQSILQTGKPLRN